MIVIRLVFMVSSSSIGFSIQAEIGAPDFLATILRLPFRRLVVANVLLETNPKLEVYSTREIPRNARSHGGGQPGLKEAVYR
jgi:hypothetical protein